MSISIEELHRAVSSLGVALKLFNEATELEAKKAFRDACIQRFEYSLELSWKTSLKTIGSNTSAAKPAIREMARANLIVNPEIWLSFVDARNNTSHSYDEDVAIKVFEKIEFFFQEATQLIEQLKHIK